MQKPGMSLVVPIFNMRTFLPDLLASLSAQLETPCTVEIIFVDDGSTDGGDEIVARWIAGSRFACRLIRQSNGGVSRARNTGMDAATGEWITFPDADDVLRNDYLKRSWKFLQSKMGHRSVVIASRILRLNDPTGAVTDDHPLRFRFENGAHVVDMINQPDYFQLHAASSFFRREDLLRSGARFPEGVSASEDAMFVIDHLLASPSAHLGLNPAAVYLYRRRAADTTIGRYISSPEVSYGARFERYARILERAAPGIGAPAWLQSMVLYELHWALGPWLRVGSPRSTVDSRLGRRILESISACARHLDPAVVYAYDATALPVEARLVILALRGTPPPGWVPEHADCFDPDTARTRWRRWILGDEETGTLIQPAGRGSDWVRPVVYFAATPLREIYEWREDNQPGRILERAVRADAARRRQFRQRAFALPSRVDDMRVRRVRWGGSRLPIGGLIRLVKEALRRSVLSRTRLRGVITEMAAGRRANGDAVVISGDGLMSPDLAARVDPAALMVTPKTMQHTSIAMRLRRSGRLLTLDPVASLAVKTFIRPRANKWNLTVFINGATDHDDHLALAEVAAIEVVRLEVSQPDQDSGRR